MAKRPDIQIPRPPKGITGQRPGADPSTPKSPTSPSPRPVTIADIYRAVAKPDLDELMHTLVQLHRHLEGRLFFVFCGLSLVLGLASGFTWWDLARIRAALPPVEVHRHD
jgi:hypothetical protein